VFGIREKPWRIYLLSNNYPKHDEIVEVEKHMPRQLDVSIEMTFAASTKTL
jgi:hypothetical protein